MDTSSAREEFVAVYGTLRRGGERENMMCGSFIGEKRLEGFIMFHHPSGYPYITPGQGSIKVELYRVSPADMPSLDRIEDVPHLYTRESVVLDGRKIWVYVWAGDVEHENRILSGDWMFHRSANTLPKCNSRQVIKTPIGELEARFVGDVLVSLLFLERTEICHTNSFGGEPVPETAEILDKEIREYFTGKRRNFTIPLHLHGTDFQKKVWRELMEIPYGETRTYGEIAGKTGMPGSARAVGGAIGKNPLTVVVPCHRVTAKNSLGGFSCGVWRKENLLEIEGISL